jgi:putative membrane protein
MAAVIVAGHAGSHAESIGRSEAWAHWSLAAEIVVPVALMLLAYGALVRRLRRRAPAALRGRHVASFLAGWLALTAALVSPLEGATEHFLAAHMLQHMLLIGVAAPLLAYGLPLARMPAALGDRGRRRLVLIRRRLSGPLPRLAAVALLVLLVHAAVVWSWHLPALYEAAVESPWLHALEHGLFLGTGLLLWWVVLEFGAATRPSPAMAAVLFIAAAQGAALGALMSFSTSPWYAAYAERAGAAGDDPLADQQLAGLLMWGLGAIAPVLVAGALLIGWLARMDRYPSSIGAAE